jgi:dihydropyrimidinase
MDVIIRNGLIVTAADSYRADIGIAGGTIAQIGRELSAGPDTRVIDASERYVFPGGVDTHTHLDSPSQNSLTADDFRSGTVAAACGGTTTIVDFCFQQHGGSLAAALEDWHARAQGKAVIDYGFHIVVVDLTDAVYDELAALPAVGITSFKLFMAYKGGPMIDDLTLARALEQARDHGAQVLVHAENGDMAYLLQRRLLAAGHTDSRYHAASRPPRVEAEATARAIALAEILGAPIFIVHISCAEALEEVTRARTRGVRVQAETCTHYLYTSEDDLARPGFEGAKYVFTPPPRHKSQQEVLWRALASGALQSVGSDHSAFNYHGQKDAGRDDFSQIPNGAPGIEERLIGVYQGVNNGWLTLNRFVDLVSTAPARMFGLYPAKGTIAIGSDADLVIWNPAAELTITQAALHHQVDYTLYEGMTMRGLPEIVLLRGRVIVERRQFVGVPGGGQFIRRARVAA